MRDGRQCPVETITDLMGPACRRRNVERLLVELGIVAAQQGPARASGPARVGSIIFPHSTSKTALAAFKNRALKSSHASIVPRKMSGGSEQVAFKLGSVSTLGDTWSG